jgi:hypothetical protein
MRGDDGILSAFVALLLVALFVLVGLGVDGGSELVAHQAAVAEAEQAARAGAGAISESGLRRGVVTLVPGEAVARAEWFTLSAGHHGTASVHGKTVTVSVSYRIPTAILGLVGVTSLPVSATASAVNLHGVVVGAP